MMEPIKYQLRCAIPGMKTQNREDVTAAVELSIRQINRREDTLEHKFKRCSWNRRVLHDKNQRGASGSHHGKKACMCIT